MLLERGGGAWRRISHADVGLRMYELKELISNHSDIFLCLVC
jgi:hypothetical protein